MSRSSFVTACWVAPSVAAACLATSALGCQPQQSKAPDAPAESAAPAAVGQTAAGPTAAGPAAAQAADERDAEKQAAQSGAAGWLLLIDQTQYGQSWDAAAPLFQSAVTKEQWVNAVKAARSPFGALASRRFRAAEYERSLPGAPDGEYVIVYYDASFAQKAAATERVTLARTPDGSWKVAGYFIQ